MLDFKETIFQSTLPARGATSLMASPGASSSAISIHAPCTGSDLRIFNDFCRRPISIHAPCTGSDAVGESVTFTVTQFQSTLPARGATVFPASISSSVRDFNPRSLHGERRAASKAAGETWDFNPRSLHGERLWLCDLLLHVVPFQSTLPARGATE